MVAEVGALSILLGMPFLAVQLYVSVRNRRALRDVTGGPWYGRTLEWATSPPPAHYNFAHIPAVHGRGELCWRKEHAERAPDPSECVDIAMPKNTGAGAFIGALSFFFGFAVVWTIWWLAVALTLIPFGVAAQRPLPASWSIAVIAICGIFWE